MNKSIAEEDAVNWLFLDLNAFFASCEQQERPELRGRPVAIVQMMTDSTCAIASSYEARAFGIKTGTMVWEAKKRCPDLALVEARHRVYVHYHHRILEAVDTCIPIEKVCSIDEAACRLMGREREPENARALAYKIKTALREKVGDCLTCSIGIAPSLFLGKVSSDMQKPDGLVIIRKKDLPDILHGMELTDIYGIAKGMKARLNRAGIYSVADLTSASRHQLRLAWGGINGALYYELLHGADLQFPSSTQSKSLGHEHVLEPALRTMNGAKQFAQHLLAKAAERLRHDGYFCRRLGVHLAAEKSWEHYWTETSFAETQSTPFLLARLLALWQDFPMIPPIKVGVVLMGLVPAAQHQLDLFIDSDPLLKKRQKLSPVIDSINRRFGRGAIGFGKSSERIQTFTGHAAFQRVPEVYEF